MIARMIQAAYRSPMQKDSEWQLVQLPEVGVDDCRGQSRTITEEHVDYMLLCSR